MRPELEREALGEDRDRGLGGGVEGIAGKRGAGGGDRAQIDDAAMAARAHAGRDRAGRVDQALDIDAAHARDFSGVVGVERSLPRDAGIVDQDGDGAELVLRARQHGVDRGGITDIGLHGDRAPARRDDLGRERLGGIGAGGVVDAHGDAALREELRARAAEAARGAGDDGDLVGPGHGERSSGRVGDGVFAVAARRRDGTHATT